MPGIITRRVPKRSSNQPTTGLAAALQRAPSNRALERSPRVIPSSALTGFRKTPDEKISTEPAHQDAPPHYDRRIGASEIFAVAVFDASLSGLDGDVLHHRQIGMADVGVAELVAPDVFDHLHHRRRREALALDLGPLLAEDFRVL